MSPLKRLLHDIVAPTVATSSISVKPAKADRVETPERTREAFAIGLKRSGSQAQAGTRSVATPAPGDVDLA